MVVSSASGMIFQLACVFFIFITPARTIITFPVKITATGGVCPTEVLLAEAREQIMREVSSVLTGQSQNIPASSCSAIPAGRPSGEYWILPATGPPAVQVYCDFNRQCGCDGPSTWTRVAFLNMSDPSHNCPENWVTYTSPVRACGKGFNSTINCRSHYPSHGQHYTRVCGRVLGYQNGFTAALFFLVRGVLIDENYLAGVSLTHGSVGSRQHIWSFASAYTEPVSVDTTTCSCSGPGSWLYNTFFVGDDYFCDSGSEDQIGHQFYSADPLWDGAGCGLNSTCCAFNNPPWFCKTLPRPATNDLEVRICGTSGRDTPVELIELYVQ